MSPLCATSRRIPIRLYVGCFLAASQAVTLHYIPTPGKPHKVPPTGSAVTDSIELAISPKASITAHGASQEAPRVAPHSPLSF